MSSTINIEKQYSHSVSGGDARSTSVSKEKSYSHSIGAVINIITGGYTDLEIADNTQIEVGYSYRVNDISLVTLTLPLDGDSAEGDSFRVLGVGMGGWRIAQNASDIIRIAGFTNSTTSGVTGYIESASQYDCVELFKVAANTWLAIMQGGSFA